MAAISGILKRALLDIAPKDLDEVIIIVPDTNKEELEHFQNFIYGENYEKKTFALKLFELLQINKTSHPNEILLETNTEIHKEVFKNLNEEPITYDTANIKKLLFEEPERLSFEELENCSNSKVLENYSQVLVDYITVPFVKCKHCQAIFMQTVFDSITVMKKHTLQHKNKKERKKLTLTEVRGILKTDPGRVGERKSEGNSEVWEHFKLLAVDDIPVPFAKCSNCDTVLIHSSKCGTSTLRKHIQTHFKDKRGEKLNHEI